MHPDVGKLLWDAQQAAERVARFTAEKTLADYEADDFLRSAVERQFEIVGEALNQLHRLDPATAANIAELPRIVAFRNVLIHGYASVDNRIVWGVIEGSLIFAACVVTSSSGSNLKRVGPVILVTAGDTRQASLPAIQTSPPADIAHPCRGGASAPKNDKISL